MKMNKIWVILFALMLFLSACGQNAPTWQEQYDLGMRYLSEENYEEAIIAFTAAIEIDPQQALAYVGRGDAYMGSGETEENLSAAQADYEMAIELDGTNAEVYIKLAEIYLSRENNELAISILERGYEATGESDILTKLEALRPETKKPVPGDWGTYAPTDYLDIPLDVTVVSNEGIQPVGTLSHRIQVDDGQCGFTAESRNNIMTIVFGDLRIDFEAWSDGGSYMLSRAVASPETWKDELSRSCPPSYMDSSKYRSQIENGSASNYNEVYKEASKNHSYGVLGGEMSRLEVNTWCLILAGYDETGSRVGYVVYQINNTEEIKSQCTVFVNEETGEIVS